MNYHHAQSSIQNLCDKEKVVETCRLFWYVGTVWQKEMELSSVSQLPVEQTVVKTITTRYLMKQRN